MGDGPARAGLRSWAAGLAEPRREWGRPSGGEEEARPKKTVGQKARLAKFFSKLDFSNTFSNGFQIHLNLESKPNLNII